MKVCKKLVAVRNDLQAMPLSKSGHNKFAGYKYFELGDFLPTVQGLFQKHGLCDVISFTEEIATMIIYDVEDGSHVTFTSPMGSANLKGCHMVQNIGAVETYQRRYLYVTALAIVEHDALDATTGSAPVEHKVKSVVEKNKEDESSLSALAETMIDIGSTCTSVKELSSFWKANQSQIDLMKEVLPDTFKELQTKFAEFKTNLKD